MARPEAWRNRGLITSCREMMYVANDGDNSGDDDLRVIARPDRRFALQDSPDGGHRRIIPNRSSTESWWA